MARKRVAILISGRGSNMVALIEAAKDTSFPAEIALVVSNEPAAQGLERARAAGIATAVVDHRPHGKDREAFERALQAVLDSSGIEIVCLAGFMRLVGARLLGEFQNAVLNIHPSLLPAFPGVDAQQQALRHGAKVSGATVHLVTGELDAGPIVVQACVPVLESDTVATLSARILAEEHRIYPEAVRTVLGGRWRIDGRRFTITA
jgi:phosphoribosylglycinamide formyltransferase-1